jgi:hypothetical protein
MIESFKRSNVFEESRVEREQHERKTFGLCSGLTEGEEMPQDPASTHIKMGEEILVDCLYPLVTSLRSMLWPRLLMAPVYVTHCNTCSLRSRS